MSKVTRELARTALAGRNTALNGAAFTLGRWISDRALDQTVAEDAMYWA